MIYLFQAILFVFVLACVLLADMFWAGWHSGERLHNTASIANFVYPSIAVASGLIYAGLDYFMLDFLRLVPGVVYVIA